MAPGKRADLTIANCFPNKIPKMALVSKLARYPQGACQVTDL